MDKLAPIVLFVYNRPNHTRQVLESLMANTLAAESTLYVFADGPRANATQETIDSIMAVRQLLREKPWCGNVILREAEKNIGVADSIVGGVTEVVNRHGKIIVLEDDLILHPDFLQYMNASLDKYENEEHVYAITGYQFPLQFPDSVPDAFFLDEINSWTWATWKRAWVYFDPKVTGWERLQTDKAFRRRFNFDNAVQYAEMLEDQLNGKIDAWDIRWYWAVFNRKGVSLFPKYSLVKNIGFDGSGIHCFEGQQEEDQMREGRFNPQLPTEIKINKTARSIIVDYWRLRYNHDFTTRVRRKLLQIMGKR